MLDAHPSDPSVVLSASHDGKLILWDILQGKELKSKFVLRITDDMAIIKNE